MGNVSIAVDIVCPYFVNTNGEGKKYKSYITCEGIESAQYNTTRFKKRKDRDAYIEKYCKCIDSKCPIAAAISRKYEE